MSGIAVFGNGEATIGLVPRYLRAREHSATPAWAPDEADGQATPVLEPEVLLPLKDATPSMTEEMRRRIADVSKPDRRGARPIWFGMLAVAVILVAVLLFPDTVVALLPDPSP